MKSYTQFLALTVLACLILQQASCAPEGPMQNLMDRVKADAQEAMEHAQEAASRAVEHAKTAVHDALQTAHQAAQQGMETGREWVEYGKNVAATFSNHTILDKPEGQMGQ